MSTNPIPQTKIKFFEDREIIDNLYSCWAKRILRDYGLSNDFNGDLTPNDLMLNGLSIALDFKNKYQDFIIHYMLAPGIDYYDSQNLIYDYNQTLFFCTTTYLEYLIDPFPFGGDLINKFRVVDIAKTIVVLDNLIIVQQHIYSNLYNFEEWISKYIKLRGRLTLRFHYLTFEDFNSVEKNFYNNLNMPNSKQPFLKAIKKTLRELFK